MNFIQIYGMTEMAPNMTILADVFHRGEGLARGKVRSAGQAAFGVEVRIVDSQGDELPRGEAGETAVLSPALMLGYWNKPEETASALGRPGRGGLDRAIKQFSSGVIGGQNSKAKVTMKKAYRYRPFRIAELSLCYVLGKLP